MSQPPLTNGTRLAVDCRRPATSPTPAKTVRILLADDHEIVRHGLRTLLESQEGWSVVGEASNGNDAVEKTIKLVPDVVVLDVGMPELNGLEAIRRIRHALPQVEVIVLSVHEAEQVVRNALGSGARAYLAKSDAGRDLVAAVEAALRHKPFFSPKISESAGFESGGGETSIADLTARERETAQLLAEGLGNKDIATRLDISVKTVETHRTNIMRKIGAHSLADVVRYAIRNGLAEP
jgi:DNA-binding NarL/FixJ family response regulator